MTPLLFHWTTPRQAAAALSSGRMRARRWRHHLEDGDRFASGTSWSEDPWRWRADHGVRLAIDPTGVPNRIHAIAASRTHWRTLAMTDPSADPRAWIDEPTTVDEHFVEGSIRAFGDHLVAVLVTGSVPDDLARHLRDLATGLPRGTFEDGGVPDGPTFT